ncbi:ETC complex I subunit [Acidiphilium sp. AL]|uniref:ETC complex I subunit n=1 Tax=Acidiphilium iwatense TaxID=768198 RepID=A0ABS9DUX2_9PROT|nr:MULTISPECIES: ETC complex I subunit [Acidiphilium]MCF3946528.1 ETC complex I subunit [Acidiphilium iwatense]MCU4160429.1 ETC complex I subunit [Acidiphilium sp. AL]
MTRARIFLPPKSAMQSGWAKTRRWVLQFEPKMAKRLDPLMGWTGSGDTLATQVRLFFETRDEAVAYAERHGIKFDLEIPTEHRCRPKAYADNFRFDRRSNWTH